MADLTARNPTLSQYAFVLPCMFCYLRMLEYVCACVCYPERRRMRRRRLRVGEEEEKERKRRERWMRAVWGPWVF